ncbi:hypothetical protein ACH41E_24350 [Streptomyces sp. NPDC020412]|uniref:hypothetical protein n=1 Tax=Streptomyces sp. NPDC020412 TaxID=3365073 RepID=UPI0037B9A9AC
MAIDLGRQYSDALRVVLSVLALTPIAAAVAIRFREDTAVVVIAGLVWAVLMALLPVGIRAGRRSREEYAARLLAAGFTSVTDRNGRLRYVPPGGLPGPGEPMPGGT